MGRASEALAVSSDADGLSRDDLDRGARVGDYLVGAVLARGGCGSVYHATHVTLGHRVAVKVLHASLAGQPKMVERFLREVELVNMLRHPNIVEIREAGVLPDRRPYFAMEYLDGGTLDDLLRGKGRLVAEEVHDVLEPVCEALAAAHAAGIVHRDVKASNIAFTGAERRIKLLDFGIAKLVSPTFGHAGLTTVGRQLGTPTIMAPEQLLGAVVDGRVDVYQLGVLAYRLLTGRSPFEAKSPGALARKHLEEPPPRPSRATPVSPAVDAVVLRAMEKRPERRFDSVRTFIAALAAAVGKEGSGPASARVVPAKGVAIYLDLLLGDSGEELDDSLFADLGALLDLAEERLSREGFVVAQATGTGVLGVRPLSADAEEQRRERREAIAVATALRGQIERRSTADARVHPNLAMHVGEISLRAAERPEIVGGALLRTAAWAPRDEVIGIAATPSVVEGLGDIDAPLAVLDRR